MINGKVAGIAFGGFAGYLLLSKAFNVVNNCVKNVCLASEWKAYYKYSKDPLTVPPGYACGTRKINDNEEVFVENPKEVNKNGDASKTDKTESILQSIKDVIKDIKVELKASNGASEGQTEASVEDICTSEDSEEEKTVEVEENDDETVD